MFLIAGITMDGQQHNKDSSHYQMETRTSMESDHDRSLVNDVLTRLGFGGVGNKGKDDCSVNEDKDTPDQASTENHNQKVGVHLLSFIYTNAYKIRFIYIIGYCV